MTPELGIVDGAGSTGIESKSPGSLVLRRISLPTTPSFKNQGRSPVVSHLEDSGCLLDHSPLNSESSSHLTIEPENSVQSYLDELSAEEAELSKSLNLDSEDSQLRHL